jgi:cyclic pyranopterin phosphate synthase
MGFTHLDAAGNAVMVDISEKKTSQRKAVAAGCIQMSQTCFNALREGLVKKGDVLSVAQVAGIMATKQTANLIPLCHTLYLTKSKVEFTLHPKSCEITATCSVACEGRTGAEMEALTGVSVALLTVYDMCKAIDRHMQITRLHLLEKTGGKYGHFVHSEKENK